MLEVISSLFQEGDHIKIYFKNSSKSIEGAVLKISPDAIAVKTAEGKNVVVKDSEVKLVEQVGIAPPQEVEADYRASLGLMSYYDEAKKCQSAGDFQTAIEYYLKAIEKDHNTEEAIKDLGDLYLSLYKRGDDEMYREEAIQLMDRCSEKLSNSISTLSYLENFHYSVGDFSRFVDVVNELLDCYGITKAGRIDLLYKKSEALVQLGAIGEAFDVIEEILALDPMNSKALDLKFNIEKNIDNIDKIILANEFDQLDIVGGSRGVSKFIHDTIENYIEYVKDPGSIVKSRNFDKKTLREIQKLVEGAGKAGDIERVKYLSRYRNVMVRYCKEMAQNHISEKSNYDIIRFFYNEAFALEESYGKYERQIPLFIMTHCYDYTKLMNMITEPLSIDEALEKCVSSRSNRKCWDSILSMTLYNREIAANIISRLYLNDELRRLSIEALKQFGLEGLSPSISKEEFVEAWNSARCSRANEYAQAVTEIKKLYDVSNLENVCSQLRSLHSIIMGWMVSLDRRRINEIVTNIQPMLEAYLRSTGFRNRQSNLNNALALVDRFIDDIVSGPTKLSYDALLPLLERIKTLISASFMELMKYPPKIKVSLLSPKTPVDEDNVASIQIAVSNDRDSSPAREVSLVVEETDGITTLEGGEKSYNLIEGGDTQIFKLKIKVPDKVIKDKATALEIECRYKNGTYEEVFASSCTLKLYSEKDFCPIENPYAPYSSGGPVKDANMFYGRDEFISNIVKAIIQSSSKQIIIYGQKRCGKSSVLMHLGEELKKTGKTFCVSFSLDAISKELNEVTFYYKILSSIASELDILRSGKNAKNIPQFSIPKIGEFESEDEYNPLNTFMKYIVKFKLACREIKEWKDRRLVVMIDEFTYLYAQIKRGIVSDTIMRQWKAVTQNEMAQFSAVLVGQDVVPLFKKEDYARNSFGVIQDIRLTYLKEKDARRLIEEPIRGDDKRYIRDAVSKILEYTSTNPFYIQIFCSRLVDYMNENRLISVTEADVENVAGTFIEGSDALSDDKFDNLISAGEGDDLREFEKEKVLKVLKAIAHTSRNLGYCSRANIDVLDDNDEEDRIFKSLTDREVLQKRDEDNYKIQVKLFQEWLLVH